MVGKIGSELAPAISLLNGGEVVAIPTETVYGLAANATNIKAITKVFAIKNRPFFDPLIVHFGQWRQLHAYVEHVPPLAEKLAQQYMPGPLTILLQKKMAIPDLVTAGSPLVAARIPNHPLTLRLLQQLDYPLAAPSANPFGYISPTTTTHVADQLGNKIPYILDGGPCQVGVESTIVSFEHAAPTVLRKGGLPIEAIEAVIGPVAVSAVSSSKPLAPGTLKSHYAPRIPLKVGHIESLFQQHPNVRVGVLSFSQNYHQFNPTKQYILSTAANLEEAAQRLFDGLRSLDQADIDLILAEWVPEKGLGRAINDRLRRASHQE